MVLDYLLKPMEGQIKSMHNLFRICRYISIYYFGQSTTLNLPILYRFTQGQPQTLLFCTLISENQGLEKSRSVSDLRKISGPAHLIFFSVCHLIFFQVYGINLAFFLGLHLEKKSRFAGTENFLRSEADLDFSRPWFSEIKVQIKRP